MIDFVDGLGYLLWADFNATFCYFFTKTDYIISLKMLSDEEIGGHDGMEAFVNGGYLKKLNIGFALDEGVVASGYL